MKERLQKLLASRGVASRRACEKLISEGRVTVNGGAAALGDSADPALDEVAVDGVPLGVPSERVYILLNKPRGYVTTLRDERGRRTVADLVRGCPARVFPVGRLDLDSEGLLLLTSDGELALRLTHPSHGVEKTYRVKVRGDAALDDGALTRLRAPMDVDGREVRAVNVRKISADGVEITVREGRNRQVRRMCAQCGLAVARLTRVSEGGLTLGALPSGAWRYLTADEVAALKNLPEN
jgi:23S rRNA pseudouridine2605 synthase